MFEKLIVLFGCCIATYIIDNGLHYMHVYFKSNYFLVSQSLCYNYVGNKCKTLMYNNYE